MFCCNKVNIIVIGKKPKSLKETQKSVEKFLQITSFNIAIKINLFTRLEEKIRYNSPKFSTSYKKYVARNMKHF